MIISSVDQLFRAIREERANEITTIALLSDNSLPLETLEQIFKILPTCKNVPNAVMSNT